MAEGAEGSEIVKGAEEAIEADWAMGRVRQNLEPRPKRDTRRKRKQVGSE